MAIDFPDSPSVNDSFTVGNRTWTWNGTTWELTTAADTSGDDDQIVIAARMFS